METQWARGEVRASLAPMGKGRKASKDEIHLFTQTVGGVEVVLSDGFPNLFEIDIRFGVKDKPFH